MNKIQKYIKVLIAMIFISSCDKALDINVSPNNPASSTPQLTLPAGQAALALTLEADYNLMGNFLAQYWTQGPTASQYSFLETYAITTNDYTGAWSRMYASSLEDLEFVRKVSIEDNLPNFTAIAQILQAYGFQILVDLYDQVPYNQALQGKDGITTPQFDSGEVIYDDLIVKIDEAIAMIDLTAAAKNPGNEDLIFRGDMKMWIKFANTLKLKIYLRQSEARSSVAQSGIQALYNGGAEFLGRSEDALVGFSAATNNQNPLWQNLNLTTFQNVVASNTSIDALNNNGDARITALYDVAPNSNSYVGLDQGVGTTSPLLYPDFAVPSFTNIILPAKSVLLISGIESLFMQAEAIQRGWASGSDKDLYDAAVSTSFANYGSDASTVLNSGGIYEYDNSLEAISYQRWLAFNGTQGFEAWNERRRLGVTNWTSGSSSSVFVRSATSGLSGNDYPLRLIFPSTEVSANPNVPALETLTSAVWWNK